jgi:hypothetical protein
MPASEQKSPHLTNNAGLCEECRHSREIASARGSSFRLCQLSFSDASFAKYPALPVLSCPGFAPRIDSNGADI